jgi:hypothetical protein
MFSQGRDNAINKLKEDENVYKEIAKLLDYES